MVRALSVAVLIVLSVGCNRSANGWTVAAAAPQPPSTRVVPVLPPQPFDDIVAPSPFGVSLIQESPRDNTLELSWTSSRGAARYVVQVAQGATCVGEPGKRADSYEVEGTSVELAPLPAGKYSLCVTAYSADGVSTEGTGDDESPKVSATIAR